jgi:hypothetical protein
MVENAVIEMQHREIAILAIQSKVDATDVMFWYMTSETNFYI